MDHEVHLEQGRAYNGGHHRHSVKYDTIKETPDDHQSPLKKSLSKEAISIPTEVVENKVAPFSSDIDGGYGWVIVASSFFVAFVVDGIGSSFGLMFPYILERFGASAFVTSFAGSLFVAFLVMGSISVKLVKRFSFRKVALTGSILSCIAFIASVFSPNVYFFIATYGFFGGCSCGLVFIPSIIIVNEYFHQKRGIANGIIASGSGVGLLVLAPIINVLLDTYALDGTIFFLAGVLLNMCICSCLFRTLGQNLSPLVSVTNKCDEESYGQRAVESSSSNLSGDSVDPSMKKTGDGLVSDGQGGGDHVIRPSFDINEVIKKYYNIYNEKPSNDQDNSGDAREKSQSYVQHVLANLKPGVSVHPNSTSSQHLYESQTLQSQKWYSQYQLNITNSQPVARLHKGHSLYDIPTWCQDKDKQHVLQIKMRKNLGQSDQRKNRRHSHRPSHQYSRSTSIDHGSNLYVAGSISTLVNLHNSFVHNIQATGAKTSVNPDNISKLTTNSKLSEDSKMDSEKLLTSEIMKSDGRDRPISLQPIDLHRSSIAMHVPGYTAEAIEDSVSSMESGNVALPLGYTISQLLCMPSFHFFCLGASLIQIGYPLAGAFLADYAYQLGLNTSHTAVLMSLLGGLNICGRLLAGVMVGWKVDPLLLNNVSLLLGGAACLMAPLYTEFWSLALFTCMFGFFFGFFPPLQPLIIIKHFGLDSLASAFGFLSTVKGVASILGAPLAGLIYDATGQYSISFMFGGAVFVLSSFVHCLMTCHGRCKLQKKGKL